jgi:hypothetical protein
MTRLKKVSAKAFGSSTDCGCAAAIALDAAIIRQIAATILKNRCMVSPDMRRNRK